MPIPAQEDIYQGLRTTFGPGWNTSLDTPLGIELWGDAEIIGYMWLANENLRGEALPLKMTDSLADWEWVFNIIPASTATVAERQAEVAVRFKLAAGNRLADITAICTDVLGAAALNGVMTPTDARSWFYMPGVIPGPPGQEYASNRASITVHVDVTTHGATETNTRITKLEGLLSKLLPIWMRFRVGLGPADATGGVVSDVGTSELTIL